MTKQINQNKPIRKPDHEKTEGNPKIPAPITVPASVKVVTQNFLSIIKIKNKFLNRFLFIKELWAYSLTDRIIGFGPVDRGSIPRRPIHKV